MRDWAVFQKYEHNDHPCGHHVLHGKIATSSVTEAPDAVFITHWKDLSVM